MASLSMPLAVYHRGGVPTDPLWNVDVRGSEPGPDTYDPYPFLNPATHVTMSATYYPDRKLQYPGGQLYAQQPFWLSLPIKERNRYWNQHRNELDRRKRVKLERSFINFSEGSEVGDKNNSGGSGGTSSTSKAMNGQHDLASRTTFSFKTNETAKETLNNTMPGINPGTRPQRVSNFAKTSPAGFGVKNQDALSQPLVAKVASRKGDFNLTKSLEDLVYTNRDLPFNCYARVPPNLGNIPLLKRVASEPCHEAHDTHTSTLSFAERRDLQRRFRLAKGMSKLQRKVLEARRSLSSVASLARDVNKQNNRQAKNQPPAWFIPPLPKEEGLGEMLANKSIRHYKVNARARDIEPNAPNQKDCIGTRWTGIGTHW